MEVMICWFVDLTKDNSEVHVAIGIYFVVELRVLKSNSESSLSIFSRDHVRAFLVIINILDIIHLIHQLQSPSPSQSQSIPLPL
ncbi:hypothetical protein EYC80_000973 [Monilinia laxa]|uniref:Uncharacterized protein n=1 Tax=Monilinia laxa TaxID=61186 RepID=A0A5N6K8K8_MONLA|nr:hypothetical protein EYC80_000973 [Monilinia laxa]